MRSTRRSRLPGLTRAELLDAIKGHVIGQGELVATYERKAMTFISRRDLLKRAAVPSVAVRAASSRALRTLRRTDVGQQPPPAREQLESRRQGS